MGWIGGLLSVILSIMTLVSITMWWIWWEAVANDRLDTLWKDRDVKATETQDIKDCIAELKTDVAVVKNDTARIKEYLKSEK